MIDHYWLSWTDLSDHWLLQRLLQRGVPEDIARGWVRHRDDDFEQELITDALKGDWP